LIILNILIKTISGYSVCTEIYKIMVLPLLMMIKIINQQNWGENRNISF